MLGLYFFNIGKDDLEEGDIAPTTAEDCVEQLLPWTDDFPTASTPSRVRPVTQNLNMTPISGTVDYEIEIGILDPQARWVPPLGPVGTPDTMGISTKGDLYTSLLGMV